MFRPVPDLTFVQQPDEPINQTLVLARRLLFLIACAGSISAYAGIITWHNGVIVLRSKQVLVGEVTIQPALDVVLFRGQHESTFYAVRDIDYVTYHDDQAQMARKFVCLDRNSKKLSTSQLYEVVVSGEISVVRRPSTSYVPAIDEVSSFEYFIVEKNEIVSMADFKKKVYPVIAASCSPDRMKHFLREKQIDPGRNADVLRLIKYYNQGILASAPPSSSGQNYY